MRLYLVLYIFLNKQARYHCTVNKHDGTGGIIANT